MLENSLSRAEYIRGQCIIGLDLTKERPLITVTASGERTVQRAIHGRLPMLGELDRAINNSLNYNGQMLDSSVYFELLNIRTERVKDEGR